MSIEERRNEQTPNSEIVLVFGATGKQGGAVATALGASGWRVRALVRRPRSDAAKSLASCGVEVFEGDYSDVESLRAAMAGVHGVFSVQPSSGSADSGITDAEEARFGQTIADLAVEADVQHLVYASAGIISKGPTGMAHLDVKLAVEAHIRSLDIASTIVRPGTFMDLMLLPGMGLDKGIISFFLRPDQAVQLIAVQDIGRIVATVFGGRDRFTGRTIDVAGDEMTGLDLQQCLSEVANRPIAYHRFPDALLESAPFLARVAKVFDEGRGAGNADIKDLNREFGPLLTFREWLKGPGNQMLQTALEIQGSGVVLR